MTKQGVGISLVFSLVMLAGTVWNGGTAFTSTDSGTQVQGEVVAVNLKDTPNVIVLRSTTTDNQELIVGAMVDPDVKIKRGTRHVSLSDIKPGESVAIVYVKTLEGLIARSINVR